MSHVNLDANAGLPMSSAAIAAYTSAVALPNPSNVLIGRGLSAMHLFDSALAEIITLLGGQPLPADSADAAGAMDGRRWSGIVLSGATEGIVTTILSMAHDETMRRHDRAFPILIGPSPHAVVSETLEWYDIPSRSCDADSADGAGTLGLILTHVLSLTGEVVDVRRMAAEYRRRSPDNALVLVDGTQAVGKVPVDLERTGADIYVFSAHKFGGPRGIGIALLNGRGRVGWKRMIPGTQQRGRRGGTLNVPSVVSTAAALREAVTGLEERMVLTAATMGDIAAGIRSMRLARVKLLSPTCPLAAHAADSAPAPDACLRRVHSGNTIYMSIPVCSRIVSRRLDVAGYEVGIGSACQTEAADAADGPEDPVAAEPSHLRISIASGQLIDVHHFLDTFRRVYLGVLADLRDETAKRLARSPSEE